MTKGWSTKRDDAGGLAWDCRTSVYVALLAGLLALAPGGCGRRDPGSFQALEASVRPDVAPQLESATGTMPSAPAMVKEPLVLIAGGDVDLSRGTGQRILRDPGYDPFVAIRPLLRRADIRFANLESPLSDQDGSTGSAENPLVFTGPPQGAEVMARGEFDIVSTANNHAWDYGKRGLVETLSNLDRVGIKHVGTDGSGEAPVGPVVLERKGQKVAFLALTAIFNDGPARLPEPRKYIASANLDKLRARISTVRKEVDWVVVSVHAGEEYVDAPIQAFQTLMAGAMNCEADVVLGHHPHTPQRVEFYHDRPVAYSMGNLVFHQHSEHPWTGWGYLTRVTLVAGSRPGIEVCPYHLLAAVPRPLTSEQEIAFMNHFRAISFGARAGKPESRSEDGCWMVFPDASRDK